jgi:uncharacterized protein (TIGR00369 family)
MNDINDIETLEKLNSDSANTMMETLGIRYTYISDGHIEGTMPVDNRTRQQFGILNGGATIALAETLAGIGSTHLCPPGLRAVGVQVSANHISSAHDGETVKGVAKLIHSGRTTHIWNIDVFTTSERLVSTVRVVNMIITDKR